MLDRETCREHILSEDYRDFIGNHVRTPFFNSLMNVHRCEQEAGIFLQMLLSSKGDFRPDHSAEIFICFDSELLFAS